MTARRSRTTRKRACTLAKTSGFESTRRAPEDAGDARESESTLVDEPANRGDASFTDGRQAEEPKRASADAALLDAQVTQWACRGAEAGARTRKQSRESPSTMAHIRDDRRPRRAMQQRASNAAKQPRESIATRSETARSDDRRRESDEEKTPQVKALRWGETPGVMGSTHALIVEPW